MKICFVARNIFSLGGVQRVVSVVANELSKIHDVHIVCLSDKYCIDRSLYDLNENINVKILPELIKDSDGIFYINKIVRGINKVSSVLNKSNFKNIATRFYYPSKVQTKFIEYFNDNNYDVIIGVEGYSSILLGVISDRLNCKTIGWQHNSFNAYLKNKNKYYWNQDILFKTFIPKLDNYIVLTDDDKKEFKEKLNLDVTRIYNPLSFTSDEKSKCNEKNILAVGRLVEQQKGFDLLLKAMAKIHTKCDDWKLTIIGDGEDKEKIITLINDLGLNNKVIIKPFTNEIKKEYLNASIFVSSSRWEGFGLVITEAMECGVPVIAFNNSGPKEIINRDGVNGILVPHSNINILAEKIMQLINDEEERMKISKNVIMRANDFNIRNIANQWDKIME